jgi:hypothetical protein
MSEIDGPQNCMDLVRPLVDTLREKDLLDTVQMMGGVASAALQHERTVIYPEERRIVTPDGFTVHNDSLSLMRPNGSRRDIDVLVLSPHEEEIGAVSDVVDEVVEESLDKSVFGFHTMDEFVERAAHPFSLQTVRAFLADRYVAEGGVMMKGVVPFGVYVPEEAMETWTLEVNGHEIPTMNPAGMVVSYLSRSMSGLRPKDHDKVQTMAGYVKNKYPEAADWLIDGPGRSQMDLAGIFHTLRWDNPWAGNRRTLEVGGLVRITAGSIPALIDHEAFLYWDESADVQRKVLKTAVFKALLLGRTESHQKIVQFFQKNVEPRVQSIVHNK